MTNYSPYRPYEDMAKELASTQTALSMSRGARRSQARAFENMKRQRDQAQVEGTRHAAMVTSQLDKENQKLREHIVKMATMTLTPPTLLNPQMEQENRDLRAEQANCNEALAACQSQGAGAIRSLKEKLSTVETTNKTLLNSFRGACKTISDMESEAKDHAFRLECARSVGIARCEYWKTRRDRLKEEMVDLEKRRWLWLLSSNEWRKECFKLRAQLNELNEKGVSGA